MKLDLEPHEVKKLMTAYILNLIDLAFTLYVLRHGAYELNPLMRCARFQIFYKVFVVGAFCWLLAYLGCRKGLIFCAAAYGSAVLWHIVNIAAVWTA